MEDRPRAGTRRARSAAGGPVERPLDLLSSSDVLRTVVDGALAAVVVMDADGRVRGWGPQAEELFGWSHAEAMGKELASLIVPPEVRPRHRAGLARYLETGEPRLVGRVAEMEALARSGERVPVEISINPPVRHEGSVLFIAFVRDISERRRSEERQRELYEEAASANEALRDYSNLVVHELRGPLAVIGGYASMLADGSLLGQAPAPVREAAEELRRQASMANDLVERLMTAARLDAGALKPDLQPVVVEEAIRALVERTAARAALAGGSVTSRAELPGCLARADPGWTATILDNLVTNALVHSGADPRVEIDGRDGDPVAIWVTDSGPGISEKARRRVFERFFRARRQAEVPGTGLGLYLSRRLARLQGGDLVLEPNADGRGARFRLELQPEPGLDKRAAGGL